MKWSIIADSSCDLFTEETAKDGIGFQTVPFSIRVGDDELIDDEALDTTELLEQLEACPGVPRTSCPAPGAWIEKFQKAEKAIAITISSRLSGSYSSAVTARDIVMEAYPDKDIVVLDSKATGPMLALCIARLREWIRAGFGMEAVAGKARAMLSDAHIVFALCSFDNLVRNGRMSAIAGFVARKLGMWGIGVGSDQGEIRIRGKARGRKTALSMILREMTERNFQGGEVAISHCHNASMAAQLKDIILKRWSNARVTILRTRGLDSFYAEREGLIVAFSG